MTVVLIFYLFWITSYQDFLTSHNILKYQDGKDLKLSKDAAIVVDKFFSYLISHVKCQASPVSNSSSGAPAEPSSYGSAITGLKGYQIEGPDKKVRSAVGGQSFIISHSIWSVCSFPEFITLRNWSIFRDHLFAVFLTCPLPLDRDGILS